MLVYLANGLQAVSNSICCISLIVCDTRVLKDAMAGFVSVQTVCFVLWVDFYRA